MCQVINAGCLNGEGIIWELMTCVTKQYCVLWHFARLICVSKHSTLPLYPQALPSGPCGGNTPTRACLISVHAASFALWVDCVPFVGKGCLCQSSQISLPLQYAWTSNHKNRKVHEWLDTFGLNCTESNYRHISSLWNMEISTRHQMNDSCPILKFKGEIEGRGGCLMPCHRSFCITQLFSY